MMMLSMLNIMLITSIVKLTLLIASFHKGAQPFFINWTQTEKNSSGKGNKKKDLKMNSTQISKILIKNSNLWKPKLMKWTKTTSRSSAKWNKTTKKKTSRLNTLKKRLSVPRNPSLMSSAERSLVLHWDHSIMKESMMLGMKIRKMLMRSGSENVINLFI